MLRYAADKTGQYSRSRTVEYHKKRRHALYFQCVAESNFDNVVKSEFHEIEARARGEHRIVSATQTSTLRMMGSMPPASCSMT